MSELAFNMNGEPFEVPGAATGWRVRQMQSKGTPKVMYGRDGLPLVLPIEAGVDDLRDAVGVSGRFRLDPVEGHHAIPNAPAGYVFVHDSDAPAAVAKASLPPASDSVVIEAMRMNAEIAKSVVDRFASMMDSAATLLRAADGAGLPARLPMAIDVGDEVEADTEPAAENPGFDLNALVAQLVPVLIAGFATGKVKVPDLSSILDWRKAGKRKTATATAATTTAKEPMPVLDPAAMAHLIAVQSAMEPHEIAFVQEAAKELSPAELRSWFDELAKLSVPDAIARIRELIAGKQKKDGAS